MYFSRILVLTAALTFAPVAFGYIDPASGSVIVSAIVGFFVAITMAVKSYWYKLKGLFRHPRVEETHPSEDLVED